MYSNHHVAVVMPVYNERDHLASALSSIPEFVDLVIVVDDGSTDSTWSVLSGMPDARLVKLRHLSNRGVGAAIKTGYRHCLSTNASMIAIMDGDGQMDGNDLPRMLDRVVAGADFVKGNRFLGPTIARMPWARWFGNAALSKLTSVACGFRGNLDSQCGYSAIRRGALARLDLEQLYDRYGFHNEMLFLCRRQGLLIATVPVKTVYKSEISHINPFIAVPTILWLILRGYIRRRLAQSSVDRTEGPVPEAVSGD